MKIRSLLINLYIFILFYAYLLPKNIYENLEWDWNKIDTLDLNFPKDFLFGFATSEYQISGKNHCYNSNWAYFENKINDPKIQSSDSCNHWDLYKDDIRLMKNFGVNAYRFSIEWSKVEPTEGNFDNDSIKHYHDLCDKLISNGIIPIVSLHHFSHPQWFQEKDAFEKETNIEYFVKFCEKMFNEYSEKIPIWCTINEPGIYVMQTYFRNVYPHNNKGLIIAGIVTRNLLKAHIAVYNTLKSKPNGEKIKIGIAHNITQCDPYNPNNYIEKIITKWFNNIFHDAISEFFIKNKFEFYFTPFKFINKLISKFINVNFEYQQPTLDFIGLNYYSRILINWCNPFKESYRKKDIKTDMQYTIYPEGLYRAISTLSKINVPIYITENGIADEKDNLRETWLKKYLYVVSKALKDGYNIKGYFYWSLFDNFEWDLGFAKKFGIYEVDLQTKERKMRQSGDYYRQVIQKFST